MWASAGKHLFAETREIDNQKLTPCFLFFQEFSSLYFLAGGILTAYARTSRICLASVSALLESKGKAAAQSKGEAPKVEMRSLLCVL